jgi:hypothetical protein
LTSPQVSYKIELNPPNYCRLNFIPAHGVLKRVRPFCASLSLSLYNVTCVWDFLCTSSSIDFGIQKEEIEVQASLVFVEPGKLRTTAVITVDGGISYYLMIEAEAEPLPVRTAPTDHIGFV